MAAASNVITFGLLHMRHGEWEWWLRTTGFYIYAFSRRFYPKRLTIAFRLYIFISTCVPWESNPQPFAQQMQCSTTEPHRNMHHEGFSPSGNPFRMIKVTRRCLCALDMWKKPWFLSQGPVLGAPCHRATLTKDTSLTGWGAVMSGPRSVESYPSHVSHQISWRCWQYLKLWNTFSQTREAIMC